MIKSEQNTFLGENIVPDVKVLVPDVKVLVPDVKVLVLDVKVLVPGCGSTAPWVCQLWSGNAAGRVMNIFEKYLTLWLIVLTKL